MIREMLWSFSGCSIFSLNLSTFCMRADFVSDSGRAGMDVIEHQLINS